MTFVIGKRLLRLRHVPVTNFIKRRGDKTTTSQWRNVQEAMQHLETSQGVAGQIIPGKTTFTFAETKQELEHFSIIAGHCEYIGREGIEFYPQELQLFRFESLGPQPGTVWLRNIQVAKSKYRILQTRILLETIYLHPLVKGPAIEAFRHNYDGLIVAFPYEVSNPLQPVSRNELKMTSHFLLEYYEQHREMIEQQTKFSDKIRGEDPGEFYGLARTGPYSFADTYVAFRDNTKWCAAAIVGAC